MLYHHTVSWRRRKWYVLHGAKPLPRPPFMFKKLGPDCIPATLGKVYLRKVLKCNSLVAVKTVDIWDMPREAKALHHVGDHNNITRFFEIYGNEHKESRKMIILEHCDSGDLSEYKINFQGNLPETFLWSALIDLAKGLQHIHAAGVVR